MLALLILIYGCASRAPSSTSKVDDSDALLTALSELKVGDSRDAVTHGLGKPTDYGHLNPVYVPPDEPGGGSLQHPERHFSHWKRGPVSAYLEFRLDRRLYRIRYYDARRSHDGPYEMVCDKP